MKENKKTNGKKVLIYYLVLAACLLVIAAVTVTVIFSVKSNGGQDITIDAGNGENTDGGNGGNEEENPNEGNQQPTLGVNEFISPLEDVNVINSFTFYKNSTLNSYYLHTGLDFSAEVGTQVMAALDGTVESVYQNDVLTGTTVTISHENGLKTTYSFIDAVEGLTEGKTVSRGDVIGTVASPTGKEYKDGAHLHFEVVENGTAIDPELYLSVSDK